MHSNLILPLFALDKAPHRATIRRVEKFVHIHHNDPTGPAYTALVTMIQHVILCLLMVLIIGAVKLSIVSVWIRRQNRYQSREPIRSVKMAEQSRVIGAAVVVQHEPVDAL